MVAVNGLMSRLSTLVTPSALVQILAGPFSSDSDRLALGLTQARITNTCIASLRDREDPELANRAHKPPATRLAHAAASVCAELLHRLQMLLEHGERFGGVVAQRAVFGLCGKVSRGA